MKKRGLRAPVWTVCGRGVPASYGGLDQGGDPHTEEDGPYELAGGPLVVAYTHGVGQEEGDGDGAAKTRQIVLVG